MFKAIRRWLAYHKNMPIGDYMSRWYLVPPAWGFKYAVRLHWIRRPDVHRLPHNHPFDFYSMVLLGSYIEHRVPLGVRPIPGKRYVFYTMDEIVHKPFKWHRITKDDYHKIARIPSGSVLTLCVLPTERNPEGWGFLGEDGHHVPYEPEKFKQ